MGGESVAGMGAGEDIPGENTTIATSPMSFKNHSTSMSRSSSEAELIQVRAIEQWAIEQIAVEMRGADEAGNSKPDRVVATSTRGATKALAKLCTKRLIAAVVCIVSLAVVVFTGVILAQQPGANSVDDPAVAAANVTTNSQCALWAMQGMCEDGSGMTRYMQMHCVAECEAST